MNFCVIGSGIVGLSTALELQNEFPNAHVTIISDKTYKQTVSYIAAGIFRPGTSFIGPNTDITKKWIVDSYEFYDNIRKSTEASLAGVHELSGYMFSSVHEAVTRNHFMENLVPIYRRATEEELLLCGGNWKYGSFFQTLLIEPTSYLPYAANKFIKNHGSFMNEKINNLHTNVINGKKFDVIINCTGLGARYLCSDTNLVPIKGQVIKVNAPWIKMAFYGDYDTYIIPGSKFVTLGGSRNFDCYSEEICKHENNAIFERCTKMLPSLENTSNREYYAGLRPHRTPVRVEKDIIRTQSGDTIKIIHHYGHGGYGITTSPGTAKYTIKLVREILSSSHL